MRAEAQNCPAKSGPLRMIEPKYWHAEPRSRGGTVERHDLRGCAQSSDFFRRAVRARDLSRILRESGALMLLTPATSLRGSASPREQFFLQRLLPFGRPAEQRTGRRQRARVQRNGIACVRARVVGGLLSSCTVRPYIAKHRASSKATGSA